MTEEYTSLSYTASIHYDRRLYKEDIAGSIAHARMLGAQGVISSEEAKTIITGLYKARADLVAYSCPALYTHVYRSNICPSEIP